MSLGLGQMLGMGILGQFFGGGENNNEQGLLQQNQQQAQNQYTPLADFENQPRSLTRTWPITESRKNKISRLRYFVNKVMRGKRTR